MQVVEIHNHDEKFKYFVDAFCGNQSLSCFSCSTCSVECPVNIQGGGLDPRRIVQMVILGMEKELLDMPEIWLCMNCSKCANVCPQGVSPVKVIQLLRTRAVEQGVVSPDFTRLVADVDSLIHTYRYRFYRWLVLEKGSDEPIRFDERILAISSSTEALLSGAEKDIFFKGKIPKKFTDVDFNRCLVCHECTVSCVVARRIAAFDPVRFVRMHLLGMKADLEECPELWLCVGCESCTAVCRQGVKVQKLIKMLRKSAVARGGRAGFTVDDVETVEHAFHVLRRRMIQQAVKDCGRIEAVDISRLMEAAVGQDNEKIPA